MATGSNGENQASAQPHIIVRNLTFQDTFDCFPAWAPTDGVLGSWNSQYDSISLRDSNNVWIDHNTFEDRATADETPPLYFGVVLQVHDELLVEVDRDSLESAKKITKHEMESVAVLKVPLLVELKWGPNWAELGGLA